MARLKSAADFDKDFSEFLAENGLVSYYKDEEENSPNDSLSVLKKNHHYNLKLLRENFKSYASIQDKIEILDHQKKITIDTLQEYQNSINKLSG